MYEITEALQQMIDRANHQVVQEVQTQQTSSQLNVIGDLQADSSNGRIAPWEITWKTSA